MVAFTRSAGSQRSIPRSTGADLMGRRRCFHVPLTSSPRRRGCSVVHGTHRRGSPARRRVLSGVGGSARFRNSWTTTLHPDGSGFSPRGSFSCSYGERPAPSRRTSGAILRAPSSCCAPPRRGSRPAASRWTSAMRSPSRLLTSSWRRSAALAHFPTSATRPRSPGVSISTLPDFRALPRPTPRAESRDGDEAFPDTCIQHAHSSGVAAWYPHIRRRR